MRGRRGRGTHISRYMVTWMGTRVYLAVAAHVSDAKWREIYDRAWRVANQWEPRALSMSWRQIGSVEVRQYCLELETPEGLLIVGDAATLMTAESFVFPASLERCRPERGRKNPPSSSEGDVLIAVGRWIDSEAAPPRMRWCELLGDKTQGLPYHALIVALGLLVEHSLPAGAAIVRGDISKRDGEQARRGLASLLGEDVELPVVTDVDRMRRRLAASLSARAVNRAVRRLEPSSPELDVPVDELIGSLDTRPEARVEHELERVVLSCPHPVCLGAGTRHLLRELINAIHSNVVRGAIRERVRQWGAARTREEIARRAQRRMCLTWRAWDVIEAADLDELAFLYAAVCMDTRFLYVHQAVRALIENRALRRL